MTYNDGTGWVLFDKVEQKFLVHGNTVEYGFTSNPLEAHIYFKEETAYRRARILLEQFLVNVSKRRTTSKRTCELQLVPLTGICGIAENIVHVKKPRKTGFAIKVLLRDSLFSNGFNGFYKKSGGHSVDSMSALAPWQNIVEDDQEASMWKTRETAQAWRDAVETATLAAGTKRIKMLKLEVVPIK